MHAPPCSWDAHLAGGAIENSMLGATHAMANPLSAHFNLTHGIAIGVMLPHVIRYNGKAVPQLYGEFAAEVGVCAADDPLAPALGPVCRISGGRSELPEQPGSRGC